MLVCLMWFQQVGAQQHFTSTLGPEDVTLWAIEQHKSICKIVYQDLLQGKLTAKNKEGVTYTKQELMAILKDVLICDTLEGIHDPVRSIGCSTQNMDQFEKITFTEQQIEFFHHHHLQHLDMKGYKHKGSTPVADIRLYVLKDDLQKRLNREQKLYISWFTDQNSLHLDLIPAKSEDIFKRLYAAVFEETLSPNSAVYKNDSLLSTCTAKDKQVMPSYEVMKYMLRNPGDECHAFDSVFHFQTFANDTNVLQGLTLGIQVEGLQFNIRSIACTFSHNGYRERMGYILFNELQGFNLNDKGLIEALLLFRIRAGLDQQDKNREKKQ